MARNLLHYFSQTKNYNDNILLLSSFLCYQHMLQRLNMNNFIPAPKSHRPCSSIGGAARRIMDNAPDLESGHCGFESRRVLRCRFKSCHGQPFCQDPSSVIVKSAIRGPVWQRIYQKKVCSKNFGLKSRPFKVKYDYVKVFLLLFDVKLPYSSRPCNLEDLRRVQFC